MCWAVCVLQAVNTVHAHLGLQGDRGPPLRSACWELCNARVSANDGNHHGRPETVYSHHHRHDSSSRTSGTSCTCGTVHTQHARHLRTCPRSHHIVGSRLLGTLLSLPSPALDPSRSHQHSQNPHTGTHAHSAILKDTWARWAPWKGSCPQGPRHRS